MFVGDGSGRLLSISAEERCSEAKNEREGSGSTGEECDKEESIFRRLMLSFQQPRGTERPRPSRVVATIKQHSAGERVAIVPILKAPDQRYARTE